MAVALSSPGATEGSPPELGGDPSAYHPCPPREDCPDCGDAPASAAARFDWSWLDAAYCISLRSRDDRAAEAAEELHRVGLCRIARFYRPEKHPRSPKRGIWRSHRDVAATALAAGHTRVLILEDDVLFQRRFTPETERRISAALASLPPDWRAFYLGHWPLAAHFHRARVLRSASLCTHAYVANRRLLEWLVATPFQKTGIPRSRIGGLGIDSAMAVLPGMYAYYPMVATQRNSPHDHIRFDRPRTLKAELRDRLITRGMRANQAIAVALSPVTWILRRMQRARTHN